MYLALGRWLFFDDWNDFLECVRYWLMPDLISMFHGVFMNDFWGTTKLVIFAMLCVGIVIGKYHLIYGDSDKLKVSSSVPCRTAESNLTVACRLSFNRRST